MRILLTHLPDVCGLGAGHQGVLSEVSCSWGSKPVIPSPFLGPLRWSAVIQAAGTAMASVRELGMDEQEQNSHFIEGDGHRDRDVQPSSMWGRRKDTAAYPHEAHCPDGKGV